MKVKAYSDCSFVDNEYGAVGIYIVSDNGQEWYTSDSVPTEVKDSFTGEMYGIYCSLFYSIQKFNPDHVEIYCDSIGALDRFSKWKEHGYSGKTSRYSDMRVQMIEYFWYYARNCEVSFTWVEGHQSSSKTDFAGRVNIFCDSLAKTHRFLEELRNVDITDLFA